MGHAPTRKSFHLIRFFGNDRPENQKVDLIVCLVFHCYMICVTLFGPPLDKYQEILVRNYLQASAHTHSLTHSLAHTQLSHPLTLTHTHAPTHTQLSHPLTLTHTHVPTHTHTHSRTHSHSHTLTHPLTLTRTHAPTHTHTHSRTHSHSHARSSHISFLNFQFVWLTQNIKS